MNLKKRQAVVLVAASAITLSVAAMGVSFAATGGGHGRSSVVKTSDDSSPTPGATTSDDANDDHGANSGNDSAEDANDDKGGSSSTTEPGDDKGTDSPSPSSSSSADDHGRRHGGHGSDDKTKG